jgi:hypothetical protein
MGGTHEDCYAASAGTNICQTGFKLFDGLHGKFSVNGGEISVMERAAPP